ncbi:MAG: flagellin [Verrucomicrobiales bacterium]|nr:flagellin [Verrucomicrobiales bacterium]MDB6129063.1 flagellin [Verrucomicrobiales bacterium]
MRVTSQTFPSSLTSQLNSLAERQNALQTEAATGQRISLPEDDPAAMRRVLDMESETKNIAQYKSNISSQLELASVSFNSVQGLKKIVDRAGEIATLADGLKSPQELSLYGKEVGELVKQALQLTNTKNRGDYIFSGTKSDASPFTATFDNNQNITSVSYQGNTTVSEVEISEGVTLSSQAPGANTTGTGPAGLVTDTRTGADLFAHLISLQQNLTSGNTAAIAATDRGAIAKDEEHMAYHIGTNGAVQARLDTTNAILDQRQLSLEGLVSKETDADLAQTLVHLHETQSAYQAALQSGASMLSRSLLDYLH